MSLLVRARDTDNRAPGDETLRRDQSEVDGFSDRRIT
jgi:hypothetical protein